MCLEDLREMIERYDENMYVIKRRRIIENETTDYDAVSTDKNKKSLWGGLLQTSDRAERQVKTDDRDKERSPLKATNKRLAIDRTRCSCKKGCNHNCSCRRSEMACTHTCKCIGQCANNSEIMDDGCS
jgi:hypothetical protein